MRLSFHDRCPPRNQVNPSECDEAMSAQIESNEYCAQIQNADGPFKRCVLSVGEDTVNMYMGNCAYDVCAAAPEGTDAMKNAACQSLNAFAALCEVNSVAPSLTWREDTNCGNILFIH